MKNNEINSNEMNSEQSVELDEICEPNEAEAEAILPESDEPAEDESVLSRLFRSVREALEIEEQEIEPIDVEEGCEWEDDEAEDDTDIGNDPEAARFIYGDLHSQKESDDEFLPIIRIFEHRATKQPSEQVSASEKSDEDDDPIDWLIRRVTSPEKEEIKDDFDPSPRKMAPTIISLLICLLLMGGVAYYILCAHDLRAVMSVEQLEVSANVYCMTYTGDYGFDEYLNVGADDEQELSDFIGSQLFFGAFGAPNIGGDMSEIVGSAFNAENSITLKGTLMGTAYNADEDLMLLTLVTRPKYGYDSVSTVNMSALGYASYSRPSLFNRFDLLAAPYLPMDGMNECGLCVALLALPGEPVECIDTERPDLIANTAVRMVLDYADDVDTALALLDKYDVHPCFGTVYHLALSDYSGRSVIVEWVDGKMVLVEQPYAANGILAAPAWAESPALADSAERSERMSRTYDQYNGAMTQAQVFNTMEAVSSDGDGWIAVFDTYRSIATYSFGSDHDTRFTVSLD